MRKHRSSGTSDRIEAAGRSSRSSGGPSATALVARFAAIAVIILLMDASGSVARGQLIDPNSTETATRLSAAFRQAMLRIEPSVVSIQVGYANDASLPTAPGQVVRSDGRPKIGSGVVITAQGHIVTSYRLLQEASSARVRTADGRVYDARDLRFDATSDLAIIKIEPNAPLSYALFGDSRRLQRGDWLIAAGGGTGDASGYSAGIVGALGSRYPDLGGTYAIQHDADVDWSFAGGPLVNLGGEVVGFNLAQSMTPAGSSASFAYPINESKTILRTLLQGGAVARAYLGLRVTELTAEDARRLGAVGVQGALVVEAVPNGPAAVLGMAANDILLTFDGLAISTPQQLQAALEQKRPGDKVMLTIWRDGGRQGGQTTLIDAANRP